MDLKFYNLIVALKIERLCVADVLKERHRSGNTFSSAQSTVPSGICDIVGHIAKHHNRVFVETHENSVPWYTHKRSTNSYGEAFRINVESSDPNYNFSHIGEDEQAFVFEAQYGIWLSLMDRITAYQNSPAATKQ